jgi:saccharopine dehydrogenase-like NADP-dependent oxidoreductase
MLGFLSRDPVAGLPGEVSPFEMVDKLVGPQLAYRADEKDLVAMVNVFEGLLDGRPTRLTSRLLMERDLETGLLAMSRAVGFTASIAAQMIAAGEITATGVLSPTLDIPGGRFLEDLAGRGIHVVEQVEILE